ncbi:MAG: hypothetical protein FD189_1124 [Elusimicrobia bacterium]|nr:MAG: hypothetical protein FD189_1124 [Elusimicrobiota bacterium]
MSLRADLRLLVKEWRILLWWAAIITWGCLMLWGACQKVPGGPGERRGLPRYDDDPDDY